MVWGFVKGRIANNTLWLVAALERVRKNFTEKKLLELGLQI